MRIDTERLTTSIARLLRRAPGAIRWARRLGLANLHIPHGQAGVRKVGHRRYVGYTWDDLGDLQYTMMLAQGLRPDHFLCDVGCGSFRAGRLFIQYLERGHYLGIDKERLLIELGKEHELGADLLQEKQPQLLVDGTFGFDRFSEKADFAIAHSLFTHLPRSPIECCLGNLRSWMTPGGVFMATFCESSQPVRNPKQPHDHVRFEYTRDEILDMGRITGWRTDYLGDWSHPRGQMLARFAAEEPRRSR